MMPVVLVDPLKLNGLGRSPKVRTRIQVSLISEDESEDVEPKEEGADDFGSNF